MRIRKHGSMNVDAMIVSNPSTLQKAAMRGRYHNLSILHPCQVLLGKLGQWLIGTLDTASR